MHNVNHMRASSSIVARHRQLANRAANNCKAAMAALLRDAEGRSLANHREGSVAAEQ